MFAFTQPISVFVTVTQLNAKTTQITQPDIVTQSSSVALSVTQTVAEADTITIALTFTATN